MKSILVFLFSVLTLFAFQSCSPIADLDDSPPKGLVTDPTFQIYINEFEKYHGESTSKVSVIFADLDVHKAGICYRWTIGDLITDAYIEIDKTYWPKMSEIQKINLIFHELGHCVLNRGHVPFESPRICPTSFMYDTVMDDNCLKQYYNDYIKEMFPKWTE